MFGEEELINNHKYLYSIICVSEIAELIFLNKKDFFRKVYSDENSKKFLMNTIEVKLKWRNEHFEKMRKIFRKNDEIKKNALKFIEKKRESTRNFFLEQRPYLTSQSSRTNISIHNEKNLNNTIISNKHHPFDGEYFSFQNENAKKLEYLEKCQNIKEKIGFIPIKKNVLENYIKGNKTSFKLERDVRQLQEMKSKKLKAYRSEHKTVQKNSFELDYSNNYGKRSLLSRKINRNNNILISSFDKMEKINVVSNEKKDNNNSDAEDKKNEIFQKFKKNIQNIFMNQYKKNQTIEEMKTNTFFSISSKKINPKLI